MKKLIILLFLFISTPALALGVNKTKHNWIHIGVSDVVYALGKPDFTSNQHHAFWYNKYVLVACIIEADDGNECYMDITLKELQALKVNPSSIVKLRRKLGMINSVVEVDAPTVEVLDCVLYPDDC